MRNLKKILALVLALVMSMSLMATANAFTDDASIDADYETAAKVLADMGVFKGYPDGEFKPTQPITRQEVAAMMYRIAADDVTDKQKDLYVEGADFTDVKATDWSAGYIGYCANGGIILGYDGKFNPTDNVTGYQVLAMILRAVGYDVNGEFTGADWAKNVATTAQTLGILKNVPGTVQLSKPATRELVAELVFQTLAYVEQVEYTNAFGYQPVKVWFGGLATLGAEQFSLKADPTTDKWGRPGTVWTYDVGAKSTTIIDKPIKAYTTAVTECQFASDLKITTSKTYDLYVNAVESDYTINALDTLTQVGAQGRLTEVYADRIVMIDTFLARVTNVADATYDAAGHLKTPSSIELTVYDDGAAGATAAVTQTNGKTNYPYTVGQYVLVYAYTKTGTATAAGDVSTLWNGAAVYMEIKQAAESFEGVQSLIWYYAGKHTVNGTTYDDAAEFNLDVDCTKVTNHTWFKDMYGNLIGAVEVATVYSYATIKNIWWAGDPATGLGKAMATLQYFDGTENIVTINDITLDGTTKLTPAYAYDTAAGTGASAMLASGNTLYVASNINANAAVDKEDHSNADVLDGHLFRVATLANGSVSMTKTAELAAGAGYSVIPAYAVIAGATNVKIDAETKFLVADPSYNAAGTVITGYKYSTYTGLNSVPAFVANGIDHIDYVLGAGSTADYVYIVGDLASATSNNFILATAQAHWAVLKETVGGISYYQMTLPVPAEDGSVVTVTMTGAAKAQFDTAMTAAAGNAVLFYATYTDDVITNLTVVDGDNKDHLGGANRNALLLTDAVMPTGVAGGVIEATVANNGTPYAGCRFNVTGATKIIGDLAANMTTKNVHVIYQEVTTGTTTANYIEKVYVTDKAYTTPTTPTVPTLTAAVVSGVVTPALGATPDTTATVTSVTTAAGSTVAAGGAVCDATTATVTWYKLNESTGKYEIYNGAAFVTGTYMMGLSINTTAVHGVTGQPYVVAPTVAINGTAAVAGVASFAPYYVNITP